MNAITHWFQTEYWPAHGPWYGGAVWGNVFVIPVAFVLGAIFWPPLRRALKRFAEKETSELHRKLDHIIEHHPEIPPLPPND